MGPCLRPLRQRPFLIRHEQILIARFIGRIYDYEQDPPLPHPIVVAGFEEPGVKGLRLTTELTSGSTVSVEVRFHSEEVTVQSTASGNSSERYDTWLTDQGCVQWLLLRVAKEFGM